jgi:uncharacterized membrane protein (DUF4010 family)
MTGVLGGVVSSTATTLGYARQVAAGSVSMPGAVLVILLANATMLVRVLVLIGVVSPASLPRALVVVVPALLMALAGVAWRWRSAGAVAANGDGAFRNPTQLMTALGFGSLYALILLFSAWANDLLGAAGLMALAALSGLTDVDAITLSSMQMFNHEALVEDTALTAIAVAVGSNLVFKAVMASIAGGSALRGPVVRGLGAVLVGLAGGLAALHALA